MKLNANVAESNKYRYSSWMEDGFHPLKNLGIDNSFGEARNPTMWCPAFQHAFLFALDSCSGFGFGFCERKFVIDSFVTDFFDQRWIRL